jgi:hypothetical protein
MLVRPRLTRTEVSPNVFPWTMRHLDYVSLGQCVPVRAIPCWGGGGRIVQGKTSGEISVGDTLSWHRKNYVRLPSHLIVVSIDE